VGKLGEGESEDVCVENKERDGGGGGLSLGTTEALPPEGLDAEVVRVNVKDTEGLVTVLTVDREVEVP